jgi:hypothetical protein
MFPTSFILQHYSKQIAYVTNELRTRTKLPKTVQALFADAISFFRFPNMAMPAATDMAPMIVYPQLMVNSVYA